MGVDKPTVRLKLQELRIECPRSGSPTGKLFAATPLKSKPRSTSAAQWALDILHSFSASTAKLAASADIGTNFHLAIPRSYWGDGKAECSAIPEGVLQEGAFPRFIDVMDCFVAYGDYYMPSPDKGIAEIQAAVTKSENVVLLSATTRISGFVPVMLARIFLPNENILKIWYPIIHGHGYELTPFQLGYLYGRSTALGDLREG